MENRKLVTSAPVGAVGDDITTWALPEGAIARTGTRPGRDSGIFTRRSVSCCGNKGRTLVV